MVAGDGNHTKAPRAGPERGTGPAPGALPVRRRGPRARSGPGPAVAAGSVVRNADPRARPLPAALDARGRNVSTALAAALLERTSAAAPPRRGPAGSGRAGLRMYSIGLI
ncbi:hypothetical protein GCM10010331_57350 [Streptomyces xanthochromogenes]|nr:hypothetical protein GCM10010331_57350 [Streptomyces xanthochromogenes]